MDHSNCSLVKSGHEKGHLVCSRHGGQGRFMLKWFDLISDMSVTIIAVAGTDI